MPQGASDRSASTAVRSAIAAPRETSALHRVGNGPNAGKKVYARSPAPGRFYARRRQEDTGFIDSGKPRRPLRASPLRLLRPGETQVGGPKPRQRRRPGSREDRRAGPSYLLTSEGLMGCWAAAHREGARNGASR
jgi:hypothetical protein